NKVATVPNCPAVCTPTATNPVSRQAIINTLAIYPKPDPGTASGLLGYTATYGNQIVHEDYILTRFDYTISQKDSVFVRYFSDKASEIEPFAGAGISVGGGPLPYWVGYDHSHGQYAHRADHCRSQDLRSGFAVEPAPAP